MQECPRVMRRSKLIVGVLIALLALGTTIYQTRWKNAASQGGGPGGFGHGGGPPVSVRIDTAHLGNIDVVVDALGTVTARNTALVRTRVDGPLIKVHFAEGREVKVGALLAEIDPRPYQAALEQAQGQLAKDQALLTSAKNDLNRYQTLLTQDSIAGQQVEDQAALVHQYEGTVKSDRGTESAARLNVEFTHITAPIAGRVGLRQVDVGNIVHAADTSGIVYVTETKPIFVVFAVPADRIPAIDHLWRSGATLKAEAYDRDGKTILATGHLDGTDNQVDTTTSTVKLKAIFDNADGALFPNQFVNVRLTLETLNKQVLIATSAVQRGTPGTFVYRVNDDSSVSLKVIKLGVSRNDVAAVIDGLHAGDRIVTNGTDKLREGARVDIAVDAPAGSKGKGGGKGSSGGKPADPSSGHRREPASN